MKRSILHTTISLFTAAVFLVGCSKPREEVRPGGFVNPFGSIKSPNIDGYLQISVEGRKSSEEYGHLMIGGEFHQNDDKPNWSDKTLADCGLLHIGDFVVNPNQVKDYYKVFELDTLKALYEAGNLNTLSWSLEKGGFEGISAKPLILPQIELTSPKSTELKAGQSYAVSWKPTAGLPSDMYLFVEYKPEYRDNATYSGEASYKNKLVKTTGTSMDLTTLLAEFPKNAIINISIGCGSVDYVSDAKGDKTVEVLSTSKVACLVVTAP